MFNWLGRKLHAIAHAINTRTLQGYIEELERVKKLRDETMMSIARVTRAKEATNPLQTDSHASLNLALHHLNQTKKGCDELIDDMTEQLQRLQAKVIVDKVKLVPNRRSDL